MAKKKKYSIGHIHWAYDPIIGGVETHLKILLPEIIKSGHRVSLLTADYKGKPQEEKAAGFSIFRTPYLNLDLLLKMESKDIETNLKALYRNYIDRIKADIIHVHNMHYFSKVHIKTLEYVCKQKGIPLILTAHNVWNDNMYLDIINDIGWEHIIAVSHYIKRELWGIGIDEAKITAIHHGIDTSLYRPGIKPSRVMKKFPQLKGKRVIFHPARMSLAKGCDISVKALNLVLKHYKDSFLVLAGTRKIVDWNATQHEDIIYVNKLIEAFGIQKNVLIDSFNQREMIELYNISQVALYPSTSQEPFGLTMLESQACGIPIIVTHSGGMTEVIHDKINGYVVPVGDFSQAAFRIMFLLGDDRLRLQMGRTGREIARFNYTKELMAFRNVEIYRKAMGEKVDF